MEIRAGGLLLRPPNRSDLDAVASACTDPEIPRYIPHIPEPYTADHAAAWLTRVEREWRETDDRTFAIVDENGEPQLQGVVEIRLRDGGAVGYWLAPWARGQGVMTAAVRAVVAWAREEHGISHLSLTTHPQNAASQRVAQRAGFKRAGTTVHEPPYRDGVRTSVLFEIRRHS